MSSGTQCATCNKKSNFQCVCKKAFYCGQKCQIQDKDHLSACSYGLNFKTLSTISMLGPKTQDIPKIGWKMSEPFTGSPNIPGVKAGLIHQLITAMAFDKLATHLNKALETSLDETVDFASIKEKMIEFMKDSKRYNFENYMEDDDNDTWKNTCRHFSEDSALLFGFMRHLRFKSRSHFERQKRSRTNDRVGSVSVVWDAHLSIEEANTKLITQFNSQAPALGDVTKNVLSSALSMLPTPSQLRNMFGDYNPAISDDQQERLDNERLMKYREPRPEGSSTVTTPLMDYQKIDEYLTSAERLVGGICWNDFPLGAERGWYLAKRSEFNIKGSGSNLAFEKRQYFEYPCRKYDINRTSTYTSYFPPHLTYFRIAPDTWANTLFVAGLQAHEVSQDPVAYIQDNRRYDYWTADQIEIIKSLQGNGFGTNYSVLYGLHAAPEAQHIHSMGGLRLRPKKPNSKESSIVPLTSADLKEKIKRYFTHCFVTAAEELDLFMLGHALHTIEDSFSISHVARDSTDAKNNNYYKDEVGDVQFILERYLNYTKQEKNRHGDVEDYNSVFMPINEPKIPEGKAPEEEIKSSYTKPNDKANSYPEFMMAIHAVYMVIKRFLICVSLPREDVECGLFSETTRRFVLSKAEDVFEKIYTHSVNIPKNISIEDCKGKNQQGSINVCDVKRKTTVIDNSTRPSKSENERDAKKRRVDNNNEKPKN